jgi:hypothetical protein
MSDAVELMIRARFDAVASATDDRDWNDVLGRAGLNAESTADRRTTLLRRVPTRVALVAAVVVLATMVTAVALGWPEKIVDFFSSPPAPTKVQNWFAYDNATAPAGMNPHAISGETRKIMTARFDASGRTTDHPTLHTLYVAPREGGGFCELWTDSDGGCAPAENPSTTAESRAAGPLGVTWLSLNDNPPAFLDGFVRSGTTQTVEARFADGATATIPVTWVSAPIDAGFWVYTVPTAHRDARDALSSVVALDANGNVVGRESAPQTQPAWNPKFVQQTLPNGRKVLLPPADMAKAREAFSFRATNGSRVFLWVVPLTGGGFCQIATFGVGCGPTQPVFSGGLYGGLRSHSNRVVFAGQTKPEVATVELRYENGERERLTPINGLVVHDIDPAHFRLGARLLAAVALNRSGKAIVTQPFQPKDPYTYPCKKPTNVGHGVQKCVSPYR